MTSRQRCPSPLDIERSMIVVTQPNISCLVYYWRESVEEIVLVSHNRSFRGSRDHYAKRTRLDIAHDVGLIVITRPVSSLSFRNCELGSSRDIIYVSHVSQSAARIHVLIERYRLLRLCSSVIFVPRMTIISSFLIMFIFKDWRQGIDNLKIDNLE